MARRQGGPAGSRRQAGRRHHRPRGNRNRVKEQNVGTEIRHRNRSGHHQLRARLRGGRGQMPTPSRPRTCSCWPSRNWRIRAKCATRICCRRFSTCPARPTFPPARSRCRGTPSATTSSAAWRRSAASRMPAAWSPPPSRGSRIRAWTAPRRCCRSARPKASRSVSPVEASRRYLEHLRAGVGRQNARRAVHRRSRCWSPFPRPSTPWRAS